MLRLIGIVISIAAADAVNPSTLVPALYIASGERPLRRVLQFSAGVLTTTVTGGLIILLGPGELILDLVPHPEPHVTDWIQTGAGIAMLVAAPIIWSQRGRFRRAGSSGGDARPAFLLGAGIAAIGLPTNVPYIGAITTIVGSGRDVGTQLLLLAIYDAVFILPLGAILAVLACAPGHATRLLGAMRSLIQTHFVTALVAVLAVAGAVVLALGVSGLASA